MPLRGADIAWQILLGRMYQLSKRNVQIVTAAGNSARVYTRGRLRSKVDTAPAIFDLCGKAPSLLIVGSCDEYGKRYPSSQRTGRMDFKQIYAPGVSVQCATHNSETAYTMATGTSYCEYPFHVGPSDRH